MLPDHDLQLLTAYVDGELSHRQQELVVRLLERSPEAQQILKDLQRNAQRLQSLPARKLGPAFAEQVLDALRRPLAAKPATPPARLQRRWPNWTRYAVAASVVAVLASGLAWILNRQPNPAIPGPGPIAKKDIPADPQLPRVDHGPLVASIVDGVFGEFARPLPPDRAGVKLPIEDLAKTQWHEHFVEGMTKQQAVHLDIAVTNHRQAVKRLETVLQNKGIKVVVDPPAQIELNKNLARTEYVIYAENVRPDELAAMLFELGTDERARASIETLTVSAVTDADQTQVSSLLGINRSELQTPPVQKGAFNQFIPKEEQKPNPDVATAPPAPMRHHETRVAMVLANEARGGALSSEVRYFLNQRRQLQPGALQVIVVVRQA